MRKAYVRIAPRKCLIYKIRGYIDEAKNVAKERVYEHRIESNQNIQKAGQVLKLFTDGSIAEDTPFSKVQTRAFSILERPKLDFIAVLSHAKPSACRTYCYQRKIRRNRLSSGSFWLHQNTAGNMSIN